MVPKLELIDKEQSPIRILHHWACSGGTIISRSIANQHNVVLLSEVHPLAYLRLTEPCANYSPTDIIQQLSLQQNGRDPSLCIAAWQGAVLNLNATLTERSQSLILRSHSHVDFFCGGLASRTPMISRSLKGQVPLIELLSVRHPLDSWLSILQKGWNKQLHTNDLETFCSRALNMLQGCEGMSWIRYEEFTLKPNELLKEINNFLQLRGAKNHTYNLKNIKLSGDSGRSSDIIGMRPRQLVPNKELKQIDEALSKGIRSNYIRLCHQLGYKPEPNQSHPFFTSRSPLQSNQIHL